MIDSDGRLGCRWLEAILIDWGLHFIAFLVWRSVILSSCIFFIFFPLLSLSLRIGEKLVDCLAVRYLGMRLWASNEWPSIGLDWAVCVRLDIERGKIRFNHHVWSGISLGLKGVLVVVVLFIYDWKIAMFYVPVMLFLSFSFYFLYPSLEILYDTVTAVGFMMLKSRGEHEWTGREKGYAYMNFLRVLHILSSGRSMLWFGGWVVFWSGYGWKEVHTWGECFWYSFLCWPGEFGW